MQTILNKFTSRLINVLENSKILALSLNKKQIDTEDLFWALIESKGSIAREILDKSGFNLNEKKKNKLLNKIFVNNFNDSKKQIIFSDLAKRVIEKSVSLAARFDQFYISTEHLLFSLIDVNNFKMRKILLSNGVDGQKVVQQLELVFESAIGFETMSQTVEKLGKMMSDIGVPEEDIFNQMDKIIEQSNLLPETETKNQPVKKVLVKETSHNKDAGQKKYKIKKQKKMLLSYFARDLTDSQVQKNIDPVVGRSDEIKRVIQILSRRTKNNPVLLGEPGVGKTAIIEGLGKKILQADVPDILLNKKIYSLDLNTIVAGAMVRGEFEARIKQIIEEVKNNPDIILFIDELHNVVGAGSMPGSMDVANILKPALARGELRCIGATTFIEYKKYIEEDAALDRRFQTVQVLEPSTEEAIEILQGVKNNYEKHHLVKITDEAIQSAVEFSSQYLPEKFLPDKAIDLIDEAAAKIKVDSNIIDEDLRKLKLLEKKIEEIDEQKINKVKNEDYPTALKLKQKEVELQNEYFATQERISQKQIVDKWIGKITVQDVAEVVSQATGTPLENLVSLKKRLINIEKRLAKKIIGQDDVLKQLAFYLKRAKAGLSGKNRPLGSFMFLGTTGTGKTETAKVLAQEIFKRKNKQASLARFDMSEFADKFNLSRLIGAPAGYIGYKEGGRLTETVRRNPYCVVLFDEIEKAHPEVFNILLQILDQGELTDASGKKVNFKNTIIILTSNLGSDELNKKSIGFGSDWKNNEITQEKLMQTFRPEFLNRLDKILLFKPLSIKSMEKIVVLELNKLNKNLESKNIKLIFDKKIIQMLVQEAYSFQTGARNVRRVVENRIENNLADKILSSEIKNGEIINIGWDKEVVFKK